MVLIKNGYKPDEVIEFKYRDVFCSKSLDLRSPVKRKERKKAIVESLAYPDYLRSKLWAQRKKAFYKKFGRRCSICESTKQVHLHHVVYGKRGEEKDEQLAALCKKHHGQFHKEYGVAGNMNTQWEEFKMRFESGHA